jgi:tetratricopeptide (TPR) repeat protein
MTTFHKLMNALKGVMLGCLIGMAPAHVAAQGVTKNVANRALQQDGISADRLVSLGDFASRSNDVSDSADRYYELAIRNAPRSQTSGVAQYNRGTYWFRKYYVVKEQFSKEDATALTEAETQFYNFIDKFARPTNTIDLLSDAEFNLALVYLQQGRPTYATGWLNRMISEAVNQDKSVRIYRVVWSSNAADIIDRDVDAKQLAIFARQSIEKGLPFNDVVSEIKRWCKRQ